MIVNFCREQRNNTHQTRCRSLSQTISISFGESLFAEDHTCIAEESVLETHSKIKEIHIRQIRRKHTDLRAHKRGKTNVSWWESLRIRTWTHLSVYQAKTVPGGPPGGWPTLGSAKPGWPPGPLILAGKTPATIPTSVTRVSMFP
jgi:hypothetical protein